MEPIIIRKFRDTGELVIFFPACPSGIPGKPWLIDSWMRIGQHQAANYQGLLSITDRVTPDSTEAQAIKAEYERHYDTTLGRQYQRWQRKWG